MASEFIKHMSNQSLTNSFPVILTLTLNVNMKSCKKDKTNCASSSAITFKVRLGECFEYRMSMLTLFVVTVTSGLTLAYFMSHLPVFLVAVVDVKPKITSSESILQATPGTSVMKRVRQQNVPTNSGYCLMTSLFVFIVS